MTNEPQKTYVNRKLPSVFFPLLLIGVGVILLLKTLGVIHGNLWDMFLTVWPILLIVCGLESIIRREGIVGGVAWAGLGVIVLLANLGYLPAIYWDVVLRIWPFALVVGGLDLLLGRRSWINTVTALLAGVIVVGFLYYVIFSQPVNRSTRSETFETQAEGATQAHVVIAATTGEFDIQDGAAAENLAGGEIQLLTGDEFDYSYTVEDGTGELTLKDESDDGSSYWMPFSNNDRLWTVNLTSSMPLDITSELVVGDQALDLGNLVLNDVYSELVIGQSVITLPAAMTGSADLSLVIGDLVVYIPEGSAYSFELDTAITALDYPDDFTREDEMLYSPNGDSEGAIPVKIELPVGSLRIRYIEE